MHTKHRYLKGQTIVEVLVAVTLTAVAFVGLLALGNISIKSTSKSRNSNLATTYSTQVADWLRSTRAEYGWEAVAAKFSSDAGANPTVTYCLPTLPTTQAGFENLESGDCQSEQVTNTIYTRSMQVNLSELSAKLLRITINTSWPDNTNPSSQIEITLGKTQ